MQRNADAGILGILCTQQLHSSLDCVMRLKSRLLATKATENQQSIIYKFFFSRLHSSFVVRRSAFLVPSFSTQSLCLTFPVVLLSNNFLFVTSLTSIHGQGTLDSLSTGRRFSNTQLPSQIDRKFLKSTWLDS